MGESKTLGIDIRLWRGTRSLQSSSLEARGLWVEMQMIMQEATIPGTLADKDHKYTADTLADFLRIDPERVRRTLEELERNNVFGRLTDGTIYDRAMYDEDAKRRYLQKVRKQAGSRGAGARWQGKKPKSKETISQVEIFAVWNEAKIILHRSLDDKTKRTINGALKNHTAFEIITAIKNYAKILAGPEFFWTYKWTLKDFINRGLEKFLTWEIARSNYFRSGFTPPDAVEEAKELMP